MKIGYLIGSLLTGGSERQLSELAVAMAARGHDVEIAAYDGPGVFDQYVRDHGVVVRHMAGGSKRDKIRAIRQWAGRFDPDVMHGFMKRASSLAVIANLPSRRSRVVASDFSTATYSRSQPVLWVALALFALADRVATQTEMNRKSLGLLGPWLRHKTVVVRNGVDTRRFRPTKEVARSGPFRFLCVGTVYRLKNPVRVVEAARQLRSRRSDFSFDWIGSHGQGGMESPEYLQAMEIIRQNGLEEMIRFPGPSTRMEEVYPLYDGLVHVSLQDGIPNAVVEAMACGLPLVVSRVSDLPAIVAEGRNGVVCDENDPVSIARAMESLLEETVKERREMAKRSRNLSIRWFGRERFVDEFESLYREILGLS